VKGRAASRRASNANNYVEEREKKEENVHEEGNDHLERSRIENLI